MSFQCAPPSVDWNSPIRMAAYGTPGFAGVIAAEDADGRGARVEPARIARVNGDRPDLEAALGQRKPTPGVAAVGAAVRAVVGADIEEVRVARVDGDGLDLGRLRQAVLQLLPLAVTDPAEDPGTLAGREAADPDVDARRIGHGGVLSSDVSAVR